MKLTADPFWYLGFLLIGLSGLFQYATLARAAAHKEALSVQGTPEQFSPYTASEGFWRFTTSAHSSPA